MLVALQFETNAVVPLKVTAPEPWLAPKLPPVIVTAASTVPDDGDRLLRLGGG